MKKNLIRIAILFVVFIIGLIGFGSLLNSESTESTADLEKPTLPIINMCYGDTIINQMYGYTQEMQVAFLRDSITPLETNRELTIAVKSFGNDITSLTYEVSSADGSEIVENGKISGLKEDGDYLKATFNLKNPILMNQEYSLCLTVNINDQDVHYYTRLLQRSGLNINKYLEFVQNFYEKCVNKETATDLQASLESDDSATNSSFTDVNIHSSINQVTWGELSPQIYRKAIPSIVDINETTGSIKLNYMISAVNSNGETELYYVNEFYRMKYSQSKVMLLDFQRSATQIFDGSQSVLTSSGINLGVTDKNVEYVTNTGKDIVTFVQQGELWSYNSSADKLSRIYSFREIADGDERDDYLSHDIKIVRVGETGDIDFVLYGYMNRDAHEGEAGVGVYHYSSELNAVEEKVFIPITKSFQFLDSDLEILSYVNTQDMLYLYLEEDLYQIDFQNKSYQILQENINPDCFVVSKTQSRIAWMEEMDESNSKNITLMDLESQNTTRISAGSDEKIKALGFMNDDFVYGLAKDNCIIKDSAGNITFGMYTVRIQDFEGNIIKEYSEDSIWIPSVSFKEGLLELDRVIWQDDQYVEIAKDHIMNNLQKNEDTVTIKSTVTTVKGTQISLILQDPITDKNPLVVYAKVRLQDESNTLNMEVKDTAVKNIYYVYAYGKLDSVWTKAKDAILQADSKLGVVLNHEQQYIWERGNKLTKTQITLTDVPQAILSGEIDENALQDALGEDYTVMNLTGCTLDEVLYLVSQQRPVVVKISATETRIIVGYDLYNTWVYDPATQETTPIGINDSTALYEAAGNVFVGYIENYAARTAAE